MLQTIIKIIKRFSSSYPAAAFKIVEVQGKPQNKNVQITYQVNGKSIVVSEKPSALIKTLMLVKGFSKSDAELIYNLAVAELASHTLRIISIKVEEPITFEIEDLHTYYTFVLTANEIISSNMISNFSAADISMIYYQFYNDNKFIHLKNKLNPILNNNKTKIYLLKSPGVSE